MSHLRRPDPVCSGQRGRVRVLCHGLPATIAVGWPSVAPVSNAHDRAEGMIRGSLVHRCQMVEARSAMTTWWDSIPARSSTGWYGSRVATTGGATTGTAERVTLLQHLSGQGAAATLTVAAADTARAGRPACAAGRSARGRAHVLVRAAARGSAPLAGRLDDVHERGQGAGRADEAQVQAVQHACLP